MFLWPAYFEVEFFVAEDAHVRLHQEVDEFWVGLGLHICDDLVGSEEDSVAVFCDEFFEV